MKLLPIYKIYKIIETTELIYKERGSGRTNQSETFIDKLSNYLEDFNITGKYSINILHQYINEFSQDEKIELIALMWLGRSALGEPTEDFSNLVEQVVDFIPENYATIYIIEKPLLAKYLRKGLQKLNILPSVSS
ncbi:DUF3775 domain-containing protein [Anabaena subtropica]|uniref:DUF3775 domain-containing protein n=1 Tax=Anabaena subtropica FACHB-260 TaxID=2692884 RepID=A0ABR8CQT9_9NOST|nr:DUF3775 domain-containing protein [Anabaena subtropica]MBD2344748.1 DUF3775 domain-containing protein [Anabaena subtropica FACHB-260]